MVRKTVVDIAKKKENNENISALTCYDYNMAKLLSSQGIDILLIGDSLGNVKLGFENTIPVTVDDMLIHVKSVVRGNCGSLVVADMPFMSYEVNIEEAVRNAGTFIKEGGANAVKLEGGLEIEKQVRAIVNAKIPVMGHLGFTPQSLNKLGGFKIQAKDKDSQDKLIEDAKILEKSGVFSIVLEAIPESIAKEVTKQLSVPTIGIGAGRYCSGQVLVVDDMLGMNDCFVPKFVKKYASLSEVIKNAVKNYIHDVKTGKFPDDETIYK